VKTVAVIENMTDLIGNTPLLKWDNLFLKLEYFNPAGSAKDRAAYYMIKSLNLKKGATLIEATSGNTGIAMASVGKALGYKVILTMPDNMSVERVNLLKAYGAKVVLTDSKDGMSGAIKKAEEIHAQTPNSVILGQFENPSNALSHYNTTAPEIWHDLDGKVDIFVAGIGTGGTISGIAKFLKEKKPSVKIIGIEPSSSPFLTKGQKGAHGVMGIGAGFKPDLLDLSLIDEIVTVTEQQCYLAARNLRDQKGVLVGISSGAVVHVAKMVAQQFKDKTVVGLLPDSGERYLSTPLFKEEE
jgi:cysteine synthase A